MISPSPSSPRPLAISFANYAPRLLLTWVVARPWRSTSIASVLVVHVLAVGSLRAVVVSALLLLRVVVVSSVRPVSVLLVVLRGVGLHIGVVWALV